MNGVRPQDSPFRPYWWGVDLAEAGVDARPKGGYEFAGLPPLPFKLQGDLDWLSRQPAHKEWAINGNARTRLLELTAQSRRAAVPLPPAFTQFMVSRTLQERVRSNTECLLDLARAPVPSPKGGGHLVRFLSDRQGGLYWYLHVTDDGADHAVVCSPDFYDSEAPGAQITDPEEICFCAESFEAFLCRFWLENEIWYAVADGTPMPAGGVEYIERYRRSAD